MRTTHRCPKCRHGEVLHVPNPRDTNHDSMALGHLSIWGGVNGAIELYMCMGCGFSELYFQEPQRVEVAKLEGARVLRAAS